MTNDEVPGSPGLYRSRRLRHGSGPRWALWTLGVVLGGFLLGYAVTALFFFPSSDRPPIVAVPDLRELATDDARGALEEVGLELMIGDSFPNPRVPAGQILSQTPLPGQEVGPGTPVRVIVSGGAERRAVPVVASMTRDQALAALAATGFDVDVREMEDPSPAGRVVGIEPAPGTVVSIPATVTLAVSTGPPSVDTPDLNGLTRVEAEDVLDQVGLRLGEVEYRFAGFNAREAVVWQDPMPGASIPQGTAVRIQIASDRLPGGY